MEVELNDKDALIELPDFLEIVKEVTGIEKYSNASLAASLQLDA